MGTQCWEAGCRGRVVSLWLLYVLEEIMRAVGDKETYVE